LRLGLFFSYPGDVRFLPPRTGLRADSTAVEGDLGLEKDEFKTKHSLTSMRIITYSDLHLEFGSGWLLPPAVHRHVMILAGDIVTLRDYEPLDQILRKWKKPVLYVTGNHEYYTRRPMNEEDNRFKAWLEEKHSHVKLLLDEEMSIAGVNFFGGTRRTDFNGGDLRAMETARPRI